MKDYFFIFVFIHHSQTITRPRGPPASSEFTRIMFQPHVFIYTCKGVIYASTIMFGILAPLMEFVKGEKIEIIVYQ